MDTGTTLLTSGDNFRSWHKAYLLPSPRINTFLQLLWVPVQGVLSDGCAAGDLDMRVVMPADEAAAPNMKEKIAAFKSLVRTNPGLKACR